MCRLMHRAAYESDAFAGAAVGVKLSISSWISSYDR